MIANSNIILTRQKEAATDALANANKANGLRLPFFLWYGNQPHMH